MTLLCTSAASLNRRDSAAIYPHEVSVLCFHLFVYRVDHLMVPSVSGHRNCLVLHASEVT